MTTYWSTRDSQLVWVCPNHIPSAIYSVKIPHCCYTDCNNIRPKQEDILENIEKKCSYVPCPNTRKEGRKYCSDVCRKRKARKKYREKMKKQKMGKN